MRDFHIEILSRKDNKWYIVSEVGFRFWKNFPSNGINYIKILGDGEEGLEDFPPDDILSVAVVENY